jgi:hypothetical protein
MEDVISSLEEISTSNLEGIISSNAMGGNCMTKTVRDNAVTERLRTWIDDNYSGWGRLARLAEDSLIRAYRWRDLCAGRQFAAPDMLEFVRTISTADANWIETGVRAPVEEGYPFLTNPPTAQDRASLADRLNWVIREWAGPRGIKLYAYLESRYKKRISADDWASMILGASQPTAEMVELVCSERRYFTEWVVTGSASRNSSPGQVDPCDADSIAAWSKKWLPPPQTEP